MAHDGTSHTAKEHKAHAPSHVAVAVITCSDTRDSKRDESGRGAAQLLTDAGHSVVAQVVVPDDSVRIRGAIQWALEQSAQAVILTGGTGIGRRDVTLETVQPLLEKELPGFGEIFRVLSFEQIGSPAMMSRAIAGTHRGAMLFALPGSPNAVKLALEKLILPELGHAVRELTR